MTIFDHFLALDRALVAGGFPPASPWWLDTLESFYGTACRQAVLRVGRRGGKSSTLCRVGVVEALYGEHVVPPGDIGVVAIVSVSRDEAAQRLRTVRAIIDAIGIGYRPIDGGIELVGRPVAFKVYTASLAGVSGFTAICAIGDELAKWKDHDTGANPATEVLRSLRPTMATMPKARIFLSSSPMGRDDAHARAFDEGNTGFQRVASAVTWTANPSLTEADCRALEPDEETFWREYGIVPFDGSTSSLFGDAALRAVTRSGPLSRSPRGDVVYYAAQDPATRSNAWTIAIAHAEDVGDESVVVVDHVQEWRAPRGGALDSGATLAAIAEVLRPYRITTIATDQWAADPLAVLAEQVGLSLDVVPSTAASKVQVFEALRRRVADRAIELPDVAQLRADLLGVRKWIGKTGNFSIELAKVGSRHCDYAPSVGLVVSRVAAGVNDMPGWVSAMNAVIGGPTLGAKRGPADDATVTVELIASGFFNSYEASGTGAWAGMLAKWSVGSRSPDWNAGRVPASKEFANEVAKQREAKGI